jgi:hypothetical protein
MLSVKENKHQYLNNNFLIASIIIIIVICGALYIKGKKEVYNSIAIVTDSMEYSQPPRIDYIEGRPYIMAFSQEYCFNNPSEIDIKLNLHSEISYKDQHFSYLNINITVPAKERLVIESRSIFERELIHLLLDNSPVQLRYDATFSANGKYLLFTFRKIWESEWNQTIDAEKIYPN